MSEWWPMLLFLALLFAGTMTILLCGVASIRAERAAEAERRAESERLRPRPSPFFVAPGAGTPAVALEAGRNGFDPSRNRLEAALHEYLVKEERIAAGFASRPSLESLYRAPGRPIATKNLVRHLERELRFAADFVADPSVENLYRRSERPAWIA